MSNTVLIVGAGPVGMTLASELTRYGVAVRIVDKSLHRTDKSKAMVLWSRTLELLDRGGSRGSAPFVEAGHQIAGVTVMAGDKTVGRVAMDIIPSVHAYALTLPQSETERLLEERLSGQGLVIERGVEAASFEFGPAQTRVQLRHGEGRVETVDTAWLVGCDGAHSAVRHAVGAPFTGETMPSDWFLADVHMSGYPRLDTEASIYWHSEGVLIIFPIQPGRYRIIGDLPAAEAEAASSPSLEQVQSLIDRRGSPGMKAFDPIWLSGFRINGRKVSQYRQGHTFLAGDAAHVHSPAGGQGMNTGMQDAINLAWKLALVMRGSCDERLLDSYSQERSHVGDQVLRAAARLTSVATIRNPIAQQLRNLAGHVMLGLPRFTRTVADTMAEVSIHYPDSPLNGEYVGKGLRPGERVPPAAGIAPVGAGASLKFALFSPDAAAATDLVRMHEDLIDAQVRPPLQEGVISLVRPDGYLACSATEPAKLASYLESRLRRRNSPPGQPSASKFQNST